MWDNAWERKKTKVKWLIKCLKTNLNKDQEKNDYIILQNKNKNRELNMKLWACKKKTRKEEKTRKEIERKRKLWGGKRNKPRGMGYTLHLQNVMKKKGKKTKANNPCITS